MQRKTYGWFLSRRASLRLVQFQAIMLRDRKKDADNYIFSFVQSSKVQIVSIGEEGE